MFYMMLVIIGLISLAFCAGMIVPVMGAAIFRFDQQNIFARFFGFVRSKAGYLASFGAGALLMGVISFGMQPYTVARWLDMYDDATLGSMINHDKTILQTGQIPQDLIDWYASRNER